MDEGIGYDVVMATDSQSEADMILEQLEEEGVPAVQMARSNYPDQSQVPNERIEGEILIIVPPFSRSYAQSVIGDSAGGSWSELSEIPACNGG